VKIVEFKRMKTIASNNNKPPQGCRYPYEGKAVVYGLFGIPVQEIMFGGCDLLEVYSVSAINGAGLSLS
jgi:hypothetical protein